MATSAQIRKFIAQISPIASQVGAEYGVAPSVIAAQAALESGFGTAAPGNAYFGVKGTGQTFGTKEQGADGLYSTSGSFRSYSSLLSAARDYARLVSTRYPGVAGADPRDAFAALQADPSHQYATDKNYVSKLNASLHVLSNYGFDPNAPIPPADIPGDDTDAGAALPSVFTDSVLTGDGGLGYAPNPVPAPPVPLASPPGAFTVRDMAPLSLGDSLAFNPISAPSATLALGSNNPNYPRADAGYDLSTLTPDSGALSRLSINASGSPDDRDSAAGLSLPANVPSLASMLPSLLSNAGPSAVAPTGPAAGYNALPEDIRNAMLAVPSAPPTPPVPQADPRSIPPIPLDPPAGYGMGAPVAPPPQTVEINGNSYVVGNHYQMADGATFQANANGTFSKLANTPHNPTPLQLLLKSQAPGAMANLNNTVSAAKGVGTAALGAVGGLFSGLFGGGSKASAAPPAVPSADNGGWGALTAPPSAPSGGNSGNGGWDAYTAPAPASPSDNGGWGSYFTPAPAAPAPAPSPSNNNGGWGSYFAPSAPAAPPAPASSSNGGWGAYSAPAAPAAPASTEKPYITITHEVAIPGSAAPPKSNEMGVHWDTGAGTYVMDSPSPAAPSVPTYKTVTETVPNPKYIAPPAYATPPLAISAGYGETDPDALSTKVGNWFGMTPLGHIGSFLQGQAPLGGGLLGMLTQGFGGQQQTAASPGGGLFGMLQPSAPTITGAAVPSTNGYIYAPNSNGGYTQVGKANPNLTPSQQYAQAAQAAGGVAQGYAPAGSNNSHGYSGFGSGI